MPIDPRIPLGIQPPPPIDVVGHVRDAMTLRNLAQAGRFQQEQNEYLREQRQMQIQEKARQMAGLKIYSDLLKRHPDDPEAVKNGLIQNGYPEWAEEFVGMQEKLDKLGADKKKRLTEENKAVSELWGSYLTMDPERQLQAYGQLRSQLSRYGVTDLPEQVTAESLPAITAVGELQGRMSEVFQKHLERTAPTSEMQNFDSFYKSYLEANGLPKNAKNEMAARNEYEQSKRAKVPGVDVPLPPDVEAQKRRMNPPGGGTPDLRLVTTTNDQGQTVQRWVTPNLGEELPVGETADMRNKKDARKAAATAVESIKRLGEQIITQTGVAQRGTAAARAVKARLGNDPTFRTYQDARMMLAGNLAVLQQGSRVSDADVKAIWLPLIPDVFEDTAESAKLKWRVIYEGSGLEIQEEMATPGDQVKSNPEGAGGGGMVRMRAPNGQEREVPADQVEHYKSMGAVVVR